MTISKFLSIAILIATLATSACSTNNVGQETQILSPEENPTIQTIMARRSIRNFAANPVGRDTVDLILKCGINAPNAMNAQQWELRVVDNQKWLTDISNVQTAPGQTDSKERNIFRGAPTVIFIAHKPNAFTPVDCGLLGENICIAATALGVGSIVLGGPTSTMNTVAEFTPFIETLGFSQGYELLYCIGLGYALEKPEARPRNEAVIKYVD